MTCRASWRPFYLVSLAFRRRISARWIARRLLLCHRSSPGRPFPKEIKCKISEESMSPLLRGTFGLVLWLSCVSPCLAGEDGLLIIYIDLVNLNNQGSPTDSFFQVDHYGLLNLNTRRSYRFSVFGTARVDVEEVEEGIYCLSSVTFSNNEVTHCGEPYFKVVGGRVNNAGWWRLGYSRYDRTSNVVFSAKDSDEILARAKANFKDLLKKYGMEVNQ
jgi:hypothetical protein